MIQRCRGEAVVLLQTRRHGLRDRVEAAALREHRLVERHHAIAQRDVELLVAEVAVLRVAQLVNGAVLVHQPAHLVGVPGEVGRELRGDDEIDRAAVALAEIEQTPRGGVRQDFVLRIPLERQRHAIGGDAARAQLAHELLHEQLGAAAHERHLRFADEDGVDSHSVCSQSTPPDRACEVGPPGTPAAPAGRRCSSLTCSWVCALLAPCRAGARRRRRQPYFDQDP